MNKFVVMLGNKFVTGTYGLSDKVNDAWLFLNKGEAELHLPFFLFLSMYSLDQFKVVSI